MFFGQTLIRHIRFLANQTLHTNYLNIIHFTKKLVLHNPYDKAERQQLKEQIEAENILTEKAWLLNQLQ